MSVLEIKMRMRIIGAAIASGCLLFSLSGCSSGSQQSGPINPNVPIGLPPALPAASSNSFTGTQGPGLWNLTVDDMQQRYSYQPLTYTAAPNTTASGTFLPTIGFQALTNVSGGAGGYAVEIPGRAEIVEPGDNTAAPIFAVEQDSCFAINGIVRFHFVFMPNALNSQPPNGVYGTVSAQTSTDGKSWLFGDQVLYALPYSMGAPGIGAPIAPNTAVGSGIYLPTFPGSCSVSTAGNATISAAPNVSSTKPVSTLATTIAVGPTGFFLEDQSTGKQTNILTADASSYIGVIEPSSPLTASAVVTPKYVGFLREAGFTNPVAKTEPIGFGQVVPSSGTSMIGGTFVNDDISQFQNSNIVINLGTQDPANNGVYPLASITLPDPKNVCVYNPSANQFGAGGTAGVDQYGSETCTFNAVAVVGNAESKYSIFVGAIDVVNNNAPMGIYLFQQQ